MTNTLIVLFLAGVMGQQALRVWARMRGFLATTVKAIDRFYDRYAIDRSLALRVSAYTCANL
ncbi:hypothetical protein [Pseudomonas versuta]|uniref:Uncharacterized protein n=1 Tax=Pseudomonas versuta TaxID=1788301 RepID=A0ABX3E7B6_9PSED|nr:hypothetical protein [Pseudomonas versuta]ALE87964.1 hypothetical protein AOC04_06995 [Pseudomonas versuta]OKA20701.1 hypothetical protein BOH73_12730 [Pseudomonas versuta]